MKPLILPYPVSVDDISAIRVGRQSEGLKKWTEEQVESRCFSIIFKGSRKNLDLIASSEEEAKQWITSLEKIMSSLKNLNCQQKTEQYPSHDNGDYTGYYGCFIMIHYRILVTSQ